MHIPKLMHLHPHPHFHLHPYPLAPPLQTHPHAQRPLLIHGRKFDIRCWVLLTAPYDVYLFNQARPRHHFTHPVCARRPDTAVHGPLCTVLQYGNI